MAVIQLLFRKGSALASVELDAVIREGATASSRITDNPVEQGANMNDHIIIEPMTFTMEGVVSNIASNAFAAVTGLFTDGNQKAQATWNDLLKLQIDRTPFTLNQGLKSYPNVVIISLSTSQDVNTSNSLFFTANLKEFIFVGTETITTEQFTEPSIADKMIETVTGGLKQLKEAIT